MKTFAVASLFWKQFDVVAPLCGELADQLIDLLFAIWKFYPAGVSVNSERWLVCNGTVDLCFRKTANDAWNATSLIV